MLRYESYALHCIYIYHVVYNIYIVIDTKVATKLFPPSARPRAVFLSHGSPEDWSRTNERVPRPWNAVSSLLYGSRSSGPAFPTLAASRTRGFG